MLIRSVLDYTLDDLYWLFFQSLYVACKTILYLFVHIWVRVYKRAYAPYSFNLRYTLAPRWQFVKHSWIRWIGNIVCNHTLRGIFKNTCCNGFGECFVLLYEVFYNCFTHLKMFARILFNLKSAKVVLLLHYELPR